MAKRIKAKIKNCTARRRELSMVSPASHFSLKSYRRRSQHGRWYGKHPRPRVPPKQFGGRESPGAQPDAHGLPREAGEPRLRLIPALSKRIILGSPAVVSRNPGAAAPRRAPSKGGGPLGHLGNRAHRVHKRDPVDLPR